MFENAKTLSKICYQPAFDLIFSFIFLLFVFLEEGDIKVEQNYIFNPIFDKDGLLNFN